MPPTSLGQKSANAAGLRAGGAVAQLQAVSKSYGAVRALRDVSLAVMPGELVALLGPNGAGKTTAVRLLLGLAKPTAGLDVEAPRLLWEEIRRRVAAGKAVLLTTHHLEEADALASRIVLLNRGAVLAEGTPRQIKARIAGRRIRCSTRLTLSEIRGLAGVTEARQDENAFEIQASEAEPVVRQLLALDDGLSGLEVTSTGLEDAYLALTKADNGAEEAN